jgi:hypothetical protein
VRLFAERLFLWLLCLGLAGLSGYLVWVANGGLPRVELEDVPMWDRLTPSIIVASPLFLGLVDLALFKLLGDDATISKTMLRAAAERPLVALSTTYSFGVLIGHLFFPAFKADCVPVAEILARMIVILSPTIYALIMVATSNAEADRVHKALISQSQYWLAAEIMLAFFVGGCGGKFGLPQHSLPPV